jgi:hypothetical protein
VLDQLSCLYVGGQRVNTFTLPVIVKEKEQELDNGEMDED